MTAGAERPHPRVGTAHAFVNTLAATCLGLASAGLALGLSGCAAPGPAPQVAPTPSVAEPAPGIVPAPQPAWPQAAGREIGRNERIALYLPAAGDTMADIAARFGVGRELEWTLVELNATERPDAQSPLVVPLRPLNPLGVTPGQVQTVTILCYHRLGNGSSKMIVSPSNFEAQMTWLTRNGFEVVRLDDLGAFLAGRRPLPRKSVVITFDDGYESVHRHAFPVLRRLGLPATVFVYTDFLGAGDALTWPQLQELQASGLVEVQSHSKSHRNLIERRSGESDERYRAAIEAEMKVPRELLEKRLPPLKVRHLAYPYGDANELVLDAAARNGIDIAATVVPGGNPFYAPPMLLRRTMIFGDTSLEGFKSRLQVSRPSSTP